MSFAPDLPEQPLTSVGNAFASSAAANDLIEVIVDRFGIPSVCGKGGDKLVCDDVQLTRGTRLDPQQWFLSFSRKSGNPVGFLMLSDVKIIQAESAAGRERAKANKPAPSL